MSSETSTEQQFQVWQFFLLGGLAAATVVVFLEVFLWHADRSAAILISVTVAAAAFAGYAAYRTFAPLIGQHEGSGPEVVGGRTRVAIEREKTLVLRSIKDLEFDRAMGKVSEKDFAEMSARLRARAARLLRQLDRGTNYRTEIERELAKRLGALAPEADAARACAACGTANDPDAKFCKGCGAKLQAE